MLEKYLGKNEKLYAAFTDLENVYDIVDREAVWNVYQMYGVGGQLLVGIKSFYCDVKLYFCCLTTNRLHWRKDKLYSIPQHALGRQAGASVWGKWSSGYCSQLPQPYSVI